MANLSEDGFDGVILAAGRGTRMQPFSNRYPKPLLPILNKPLIHHQVEYLRNLGVQRIFVVIGHLGHEIALSLGRGEAFGVQIEYVEQRDALGIAHALMQLENQIERPFVLLLGDIYFETDRSINPLQVMIERRAKVFLAVMEEKEPQAIRRNFAVHMDDNWLVHRVVEKPRFPQSRWKGCGIYVFDISFFDALRRTPRSAARNEYELTDAVQTFIDDGALVTAGCMMRRDINLTFPYDLLLANLSALGLDNQDNAVAVTAQVHPDAQLKHCIIGDHVVIDKPISMRCVLALPDACIRVDEPLDRAIITSDHLVDCKYWLNLEECLSSYDFSSNRV